MSRLRPPHRIGSPPGVVESQALTRPQWVRLDPSEGAWWEPQEAVVVSGSAGCDRPSFRGCCDVLNFFERRENAERYLAENASVTGNPIFAHGGDRARSCAASAST
jgi:Alkylmercury lyase